MNLFVVYIIFLLLKKYICIFCGIYAILSNFFEKKNNNNKLAKAAAALLKMINTYFYLYIYIVLRY